MPITTVRQASIWVSPYSKNLSLVGRDGVVAFKAALWFWMQEQPPKPFLP